VFERVRGQFARLINGDVDEVAFVKNTSEGISIVANGLDWKPGDNVVIPDIEFPANVYPWWNLKRLGVETRMVEAKGGRVLFDDLTEQIDKRTRVVSVSSVECKSGFRNDLNRIGAFCKENNILFCVDAIQSLGVLEMDVKRDNIDFLSADGHKWMLSVEGLGGFYISKNVLEQIYPITVGWDKFALARFSKYKIHPALQHSTSIYVHQQKENQYYLVSHPFPELPNSGWHRHKTEYCSPYKTRQFDSSHF
jgi:selenocysteine lyase/cysteine desulfurase